MYEMKLKFSNEKMYFVEIDYPELIYGAVAVMLNNGYEENLFVINPLTKEKIPAIKGNKNRFIIPMHNKVDNELAIKYKLPIKLAVIPYFVGEDESRIREDKPTIKRHSVIAIIENDKEEILCESIKNGKRNSFVQGGIEKGETIEQAARREILEETGYKDIKIEYISNIPIINHFFAAYKGENGTNRFAKLEIVYGKLNSNDRIEISKEEKEKHEIQWIPKNKVLDFININHNLYAYQMILSKNEIYEGEGIIISNDENNEKTSFEARESITKKFSIVSAK